MKPVPQESCDPSQNESGNQEYRYLYRALQRGVFVLPSPGRARWVVSKDTDFFLYISMLLVRCALNTPSASPARHFAHHPFTPITHSACHTHCPSEA